MGAFVRLLPRYRACDIALVGLFFRTILRYDSLVQYSVKHVFLQAVARKVAAHRARLVQTTLSEHSQPEEAYRIDHLVTALDKTVFGSMKRSGMDSHVDPWATTLAERIFTAPRTSHDTTSLQWNCILLLALARSRSTDGRGQVVEPSQDSIQQAAVVEWQTICFLAAIQNVFPSDPARRAPLTGSALQAFTQLVRKLWRDWTGIPSSVAPPRSQFVTRIVIGTFFRLAGELKDRALVEACREFCVASRVWSTREDHPDVYAGLQFLAAEQFYASLVCDTFFERALVDLMVEVNPLRILRGAVDAAISRFTRIDPEQAQELVSWATNRGLVPSGHAVAQVGVALARSGCSSFLHRYLDDVRLAPEFRARVAAVHLRKFARLGKSFMDPNDVMDTVDHFIPLLSQVNDPQPLLRTLQMTLLALIRRQFPRRTLSIVLGIMDCDPSLISADFYGHLLQALLYHRRPRLAVYILGRCTRQYPQEAQRLTSMVLTKLSTARLETLASRLARRSGLLRQEFAQGHRVTRIRAQGGEATAATTTLRESTGKGRKPKNRLAPRSTVSRLARIGRFSAAKRYLRLIREHVAPDVHTSFCNTHLHACLLRRGQTDRQRLRLVLRTYRDLRERCGFVPDHVTVNVLIKAHLRTMTEVDATRARSLFDALVSRGYPTSPHHGLQGEQVRSPPFGTGATSIGGVLGQLDIPDIEAPLLYKRHVLPLYKMFVKEFYQRHDVAAARRIVGILKAMEVTGWSGGRQDATEKQ